MSRLWERFDAVMNVYGSWLDRPGEPFRRSAWRLVWSVTLIWFVLSAAVSLLLIVVLGL